VIDPATLPEATVFDTFRRTLAERDGLVLIRLAADEITQGWPDDYGPAVPPLAIRAIADHLFRGNVDAMSVRLKIMRDPPYGFVESAPWEPRLGGASPYAHRLTPRGRRFVEWLTEQG
jgi:hypothetical protein